jgi:hypothetical protein
MYWVDELIISAITPEILQEPDIDSEAILKYVHHNTAAGVMHIIPSVENHAVMIVTRNTKYRADLHIATKYSSLKTFVRACKEFRAALNTLGYSRYEARFHDKRFGSILSKLGFTHEGTLIESYITKEGDRLNEYIYALNV